MFLNMIIKTNRLMKMRDMFAVRDKGGENAVQYNAKGDGWSP